LSYVLNKTTTAAPTQSGAPVSSATNDDRRILIVDDEDSARQLFADCLGARYLCTTAANAEEAFAHLARESYALVLTDVNMPGLSGIELLRQIVVRYPDTAVVIISAIDRTQRVIDAVHLGAFNYLIKPCDLDVLEICVERALVRRSLLRDGRRYKQDLERRNTELARRKAELERLQAQIVHSEKMASLGQLAAGVAHELNNPANFIYGNMELLVESVGGIERLMAVYDALALPALVETQIKAIKEEIGYEGALEDLRSIVADCREGAERIRDVVQNLRTFSRLDEAEFKKVDLHESIDSTLRLLSRFYSSERITLERDYGDVPPVDCYAGQLNQVWMNLLVNSAQAIGATEGSVRIKTHAKDGKAFVQISDTGCGIAAANLNKIFDPFFTTKPVGDGTGLGLSITYSIIQRHRGQISVASRAGQGTTFTITLPINAKELVKNKSS
jgi:two-component system NtrC family sensor kinase